MEGQSSSVLQSLKSPESSSARPGYRERERESSLAGMFGNSTPVQNKLFTGSEECANGTAFSQGRVLLNGDG